ncbi:hypothetical protein LTS10_007586 [Elasticomyces elasticus]|nr:hypothetical protein LTS10_007586 [Elasticomyces elasticus]
MFPLSCQISFLLAIHWAAAQDFTPLWDYNDYASLQNCQQMCLDNGTVSGKYDTLASAVSNCIDLITQLDVVNSCVQVDSLGSGCRGNSSAALGAQSILAAYCTTEVALKFGIASTSIAVPEVLTISTTSATTYSSNGAVITSTRVVAVTTTIIPTESASTPISTKSAIQHELSPGSAAGIGVGAAVGGLLMIAVATWFLRRHYQSRKARAVVTSVPEKSELAGESAKRPDVQSAELDVQGTIHEVNGQGKPAEADGMAVLYELGGDWRGHEAGSRLSG